MCGIAGFDYANDVRTPASLAGQLIDALKHRGPDDDGVQRFARTDTGVVSTARIHAPIGMVHTRLSIIDLSAAGAEPMRNEDGQVWLTYNGEIYNFRALRRELEALGHVFRSQADAEVILHGYESWGDAVVTRLRGMFAFALFDCARDRWVCARDPYGIKPLVYAHRPDFFAFASDLDALRLIPGVDTTLDRSALAQYLALGYVPAPLTICQGAAKLPRGPTLIVEHGAARLARFAAPHPAPPIEDPDTAAEAIEAAILESVEAHLVADVPVGCFLSGGVDSSLVAGMAVRAGASPTCYTMGFDEPAFDERPHAEAIARSFDLPWRAEAATAVRIRDVLVDLPRIFDEPFADPSAAPTALVAALARREVKCVLSGDGGDELFLGYTRYRLFSLADRARRAPRPLRRAVGALAQRLPGRLVDQAYGRLRGLGRLPRLSHPARKLLAVAGSLSRDDRVALYADTLRVASPPVLELLTAAAEDVALEALRHAARTAPEHPALFGSLIDEETYLPEDILTKVDRATMAVGLEARVPLLDPAVGLAARAVPPELHTRGGGKAMLRAALDRVVPAELTRRPKQGFGIPLASWLRGPLAEAVRTTTTDTRLCDLGLSRAGMSRLAEEHSGGRVDHGPALWALICLKRHLARHEGP